MTKNLGLALLVVAVWAASVVAYPARAQFPFPISFTSDAPTIQISLLGSYRGGVFSTASAQGPATYDPRRHRLYVISQVRTGIEILDVRNPSQPTKVGSIELGPVGLGAQSVAFHNRTLAVAIQGPTKSSPGSVLFFDRDGELLTAPVVVGVQPSMAVFTPDGNHLVVANTGEANDDYSEDPEGSVSIVSLDERFGFLFTSVNTVHFSNFNDRRDELVRAGVRLTGPNASVAQDLEPESIAISPDGRLAWVTLGRNNALALIDIEDENLIDILPLSDKANSAGGFGLDGSDVDGQINIRPWPGLRSWLQPDMIASFVSNGQTFLVTANEGDPRDFSGYTEQAAVGSLPLDPVAFPDPSVADPVNLGRLRVSTVDGDIDGDGDYDVLYGFGGRSFSIWTADGGPVFDSGDDFEQITAAAIPQFFNTPDDENRFDAQSPGRGPEPEAMAVGQVGARQYAFVGFERIGGVIAYDITDPFFPRFEQYINARNFNINPAEVCVKDQPQSALCAQAGDLSVEGVLFIPAGQSPIGVPLLVLNHETSDSVTVFRIDAVAP
jgi:2',3'-cyclic-nucleotide 2'-phosphodiesterase / 3'-nucleotidase / 5'-nucleotidase